MKSSRTSAIGHLPGIYKKKRPNPGSPLYSVFDRIVKLLKPYEQYLKIKENSEYQYELWTTHRFRTRSFHPTGKNGILFAAAAVYFDYVSFYFYPMYLNDSLKKDLPYDIQSNLKGKSVFHFDGENEKAFEAINRLLKIGWTYYEKQGWVST